MTSKRKQVLIGLPETGKTTFLAALWHVLCANETETELHLVRYHGDHEYLNAVRERWANAEMQVRTSPNAEAEVSMILAGKTMAKEVEVCIPDLSGESYESAWSYRTLNRERAETIGNAEGVLLFVHPDRIKKEVLISEIADIVNDLDEGCEEEDENDASGTVGWDAQEAPTQIQLVDLIQCVLRLNESRPLRLGVVVSAWDRIGQEVLPADWIKCELPLLWQYLRCNDSSLVVRFFGVSAQGGRIPDDVDNLRELDRPTDRIQVIDGTGDISSDITTPLRWLMATEEA